MFIEKRENQHRLFFSIYAVHSRLPQRILLSDNIIYKLGFFKKKKSLAIVDINFSYSGS